MIHTSEDGVLDGAPCLNVYPSMLLRFDNTYSLLTDQTFVEKMERFWESLVAPTASPLISGSTMNSQPSLARPPPASLGMGILQQLLPAHLSQWGCILGTAGTMSQWQPDSHSEATKTLYLPGTSSSVKTLGSFL